jgi:hypothetical protein
MTPSLIPVPPHQLSSIGPVVEARLADALEESFGEVTMDDIRARLSAGDWLLWLGIVDGELRGVTVTELIPTPRGTWLNILFTHSSAPLRTRLMEHGYRILTSYAKSIGCRGVKMYSGRKGFERAARSLGMRPRFIEYVDEFTTGGD